MTLLPWKSTTHEAGPRSSTFEDLSLPLFPALYNVAHWLTRNPIDAEDLVQETLLKALRGFSGFEPGSNFKAWIFRILRNTFLTSRSGLAVRYTVSLEEELEEDSEGRPGHYPEGAIDRVTPELNMIRLADRSAVHKAMEQLPPLLLEVVLLCDVEEMKYKDIASILNIPIGTVMSRIARARIHLRRSLNSYTPTKELLP